MRERQSMTGSGEFGNLPLVSVVTPSYNAGPFLRATIESVLTQGYPRLQHIVFDGGSTDGSRDILAEYEHLDWASEEDRGQSDALNKGFRRAKGGVIGWLNADDTYEPGAIETAVRYLVEHPDVHAVYGDLNIMDESGAKVGVTSSKPFDPVDLLTQNMIKQPTLFMKRRVIEELGGVDERLHYVMDRELWLRMGLAGFRLHYLEGAVLASFRVCEGTKSYTDGARFLEEWQEVLLKALEHPNLRTLPARVRREVVGDNRAQYHVAKMLESIDRRDRVGMAAHMLRALRWDNALLVNRGLWRFAFLGTVGISPDKWRKFRRNEDGLRATGGARALGDSG